MRTEELEEIRTALPQKIYDWQLLFYIIIVAFSMAHSPSTYVKILIVEVNKINNTKDPKQKTVTEGQVSFTSSICLRNVTCVGKWFHTLEDSGATSGSENKSASITMIQGHHCIRVWECAHA